MEWLFNIIQFAAQHGWNLFATCAVIFAIGLSLGIPLSAIGPFVTRNNYHAGDTTTNKEENK